jgi:DNA-binding NarL/FixJ family response regulator
MARTCRQSRHSGRRPLIRLIPSLAHPTNSFPEPDASLTSAVPIRVVLVISSKLERLGWSIVLENQDDIQVFGEYADLDAALACSAANFIDVLLIDEALVTASHCEMLRKDDASRKSRVLLVASHPLDEGLAHTRYSFVSRFLLKGVSAADLLAAIRAPR